MITEPSNEKLKKQQLEQLDVMRDSLNDFIAKVENGEVYILEGRMTQEINAGTGEDIPTNELWINIEYLPRNKPPDISAEIDVCAQMANRERT